MEGWPLTTPGSSQTHNAHTMLVEGSLVECVCPVGLSCRGDYARVRTRVNGKLLAL
jgi:hypothetical protein